MAHLEQSISTHEHIYQTYLHTVKAYPQGLSDFIGQQLHVGLDKGLSNASQFCPFTHAVILCVFPGQICLDNHIKGISKLGEMFRNIGGV